MSNIDVKYRCQIYIYIYIYIYERSDLYLSAKSTLQKSVRGGGRVISLCFSISFSQHVIITYVIHTICWNLSAHKCTLTLRTCTYVYISTYFYIYIYIYIYISVYEYTGILIYLHTGILSYTYYIASYCTNIRIYEHTRTLVY